MPPRTPRERRRPRRGPPAADEAETSSPEAVPERAPPPRAARRARSAARPEEEASPLERGRAVALRVLAYHARTERQLRTRLAQDGLSEVADEVIAWVTRLGYLDDRAYARARARSLLAGGRAGPRLAERRLQAAGIPGAEARATVSAALGEDGARPADRELALCRAALERRLRGAAPAGLDEKARARHARFLAGRGFSAQVVARALGLGWAPEED
ncbi:regulatory protein RecX [Anaeromyxobacter paludicola]|uniref:Regulatory protein RecX n=1 Tax=Anaeromyxobacter paludicola TaxID=2918171 RepID=A0ABM7XFC0_9BACT|nr:RecX family transcriptional regulator [Anaeromyxobacter paludicola]BDG10598.1 hypothetical protein AMPC_37110 [Anaeromyxobacter paludicola]